MKSQGRSTLALAGTQVPGSNAPAISLHCRTPRGFFQFVFAFHAQRRLWQRGEARGINRLAAAFANAIHPFRGSAQRVINLFQFLLQSPDEREIFFAFVHIKPTSLPAGSGVVFRYSRKRSNSAWVCSRSFSSFLRSAAESVCFLFIPFLVKEPHTQKLARFIAQISLRVNKPSLGRIQPAEQVSRLVAVEFHSMASAAMNAIGCKPTSTG